MHALLSRIPSIDLCRKKLFEWDPSLAGRWQEIHPVLTAYWDSVRERIRMQKCDDVSLESHFPHMVTCVRKALRPRLRKVINATGVVVHTNLGRSTLCEEAQEALLCAARNYTNVEMDLQSGRRGSRQDIVEELLCRITHAEAAMCVNNNAAAVMLMLDTFCHEGEVIVSRGELVEIGGSFRIPEVMKKSGAVLREVGATNRTHLRDYEEALCEKTRAIMRVHTSNYRIIGFHEMVPSKELVRLSHSRGILCMEDLGSGSLLNLEAVGLPYEPTVQESVEEGLDLVSFSGDKVLGGPQAGIIVGKKHLVEELKRNQLTRALRCDKLCLAALEATLAQYVDPERAKAHIPTLRRICLQKDDLKKQAERIAGIFLQRVAKYCDISLKEENSRVGGGAFPQYDLPTWCIVLQPKFLSSTALKKRLLETDPPVIGRLEEDGFCLDPRTIDESDIAILEEMIVKALLDETKE